MGNQNVSDIALLSVLWITFTIKNMGLADWRLVNIVVRVQKLASLFKREYLRDRI